MNQHNGLSHRSPEEIEREIAHTRSEIEDTLSQLQRNLSFGQIAERAMSYLREGKGSDIASSVGRGIRDNPLPLALIGVGITWFALSQRREGGGKAPERRYVTEEYVHGEVEFEPGYEPRYAGTYSTDGEQRMERAGERVSERAKESVEGAKERMASAKEGAKARMESARERARSAAQSAKERAAGAKEKAASAVSGARGKASEVSGRARESARRASAEARYRAAQVSSQARERFSEQPLLLGFLGVVVGVVLGALTPSTQREKRMLGPARERFVSRADEIAAQQIREAGHAVERSLQEGVSQTEEALREAGREAQARADEEARRDTGKGPGVPT